VSARVSIFLIHVFTPHMFCYSNCSSSAHSIPMPWKKRFLLHVEQMQSNEECCAATVECSQAILETDADTAAPCLSGAVVNDGMSCEESDELTNEVLPPDGEGMRVDCPGESTLSEGIDGMVA
jgi:hypothetical protein